MNKTLIDNSANLKMVSVLRECISMPEMDTIRIATGYWDIPGTALVVSELQEFLSREGTKLKLLIGKDPYVYAKMLKEPKFMNKSYPDEFIRTNIDDLADNLRDEYKQVINLLLTFCENHESKIEIRTFKKNEDDESQFLHSKCYIFTSETRKSVAYGIIGSSNFTEKGLQGNAELNYIEDTAQIVRYGVEDELKGHVGWFEEKWEQAEDWTREFLEQILKPSKPVEQIKQEEEEQKKKEEEQKEEEVAAPLTPYELYIKLLQYKFGSIVDKDLGELIQDYLPKEYNTYEYQIAAVKQCYTTMKEHGGFMLADVVGLGKTIVGTLLIKHFLQMPDEDGREQKVLIVTPPAIQSAWKRTIKEFDDGCNFKIASFIDYITTGSIGKLTDDELEDIDADHDTGEFEGQLKHENYGLIIIDESHKFRNSGTNMYKALDNLIAEISSEVGAYPYIGLLSATPQNNRPADIQNQIYLFECNRSESTLKRANGGNLEGFFAEVNREFAEIMHPKDEDGNHISLPISETNKRLTELSLRVRDCVLSDIMIRRTRTDVDRYYQSDKEQQGMKFPVIKGPLSLNYMMSPTLAKLFHDSMANIAPDEGASFGLRYYRYRAIQYLLNPDNKRKYNARGSRDADTLAEQLAHIMQIGLVKRLESSFTAFKQSLLNLRQYTQNMIDMWQKDCIFICPSFNVNAELDRKAKEKKRGHKVTLDDCFDDVRKKIAKLDEDGKNDDQSNMEYHRSDFDAKYIDYLHYDIEIISGLCDRWGANDEDPKFDVFKEELKPTLFNKETNIAHKLVVFTEAIDTANSIAKAAESKGFNVLLIKADNRNEKEQIIRENFDANYKGEWKNDFDVIVTTDVLAEGINLHRANCILNYDTPWNSTRLMQRIGRVNRIGSSADKVYVYNFMPSSQGDAEIQLVQKAHNKIQSFHTLFGEDSQVFTDSEEVAHYDLNTEVNGEESPLEKYVYELKQYKEANPKRYEQIAQKTEGLELAVASEQGTAYFLVRTPRMSGMFVKVNPNEEEGSVISLADGLEAFRAKVDNKAIELPIMWKELRSEAERVVIAELASVRILHSKSKKATEAKGAIIEMKKTLNMSPESKKLLNAADMLIRQGNHDIVNRINVINRALKQQNTLFPLTQEQIDQYIKDGIEKFIATAKEKMGQPEIMLGTYK